MIQQSAEWTGRWVADKMHGRENVTSVTVLSPQRIQIVRNEFPTVVVGTTAVERVDAAVVSDLLVPAPSPSFIVNVPKESYVTGDALQLAAKHGFAIGGLGDLMRAVKLPSPAQYVSPEFTFVERGLKQHTRISRYDRLDDRSYLVIRKGLNPVHVAFLNEYELIADHLRVARDRYGDFVIAVITNPSGNPTSSALNVAASMGIQVCKWGEFLGALNRP